MKKEKKKVKLPLSTFYPPEKRLDGRSHFSDDMWFCSGCNNWKKVTENCNHSN